MTAGASPPEQNKQHSIYANFFRPHGT